MTARKPTVVPPVSWAPVATLAHGCTPAAVSLAWLVGKGIVVIPASGKNDHIRSNLGAVPVSLTPEEGAQIDALDRGRRIIDPPKAPDWDP